MSHRLTRLNAQLQREIAEIVRWEVADPRVGPATVTAVRVAPDLTSARVHVALIGDDEERRASLEGLAAAAPYIRSQLAQRLDLRRTPTLGFFPDETGATAARIEELLAEVEPAEGWESTGEAPDDPNPEPPDDPSPEPADDPNPEPADGPNPEPADDPNPEPRDAEPETPVGS